MRLLMLAAATVLSACDSPMDRCFKEKMRLTNESGELEKPQYQYLRETFEAQARAQCGKETDWR